MTRESRYDRGPQFDVLRAQRRGSKDGDTIETRPASGHPDGVETQLLCLLNECEYLMGLLPTDSDAKQSVWHTLPSSPRSHSHVRRGAHDIKVSLVPVGIIPLLGTDKSPVNASHRNYFRWATESDAPAVTRPHYSPAAAQKCAAWPASGSAYRSVRRAHHWPATLHTGATPSQPRSPRRPADHRRQAPGAAVRRQGGLPRTWW